MWQLLRDRWAARAARLDALEKRVAKLEAQVQSLAKNLSDVYSEQLSAAAVGYQINAHLTARPRFNWGHTP